MRPEYTIPIDFVAPQLISRGKEYIDIIKPVKIRVPEPTPTEIPVPQSTLKPEVKISVDKDLLRIVSLESDGSYKGSLAVASVIFNMVEKGTWGHTIHAVVSHDGVFSTYGATKKRKITDTVLEACTDATNGKRNLPKNVLYFCTPHAYKHSKFFQSLEIYAEFSGAIWCHD